MHESEAFYEEILYPLQNGVLTTLANSSTGFYLTGGTALHRHYFGDRYSDDLDLFVNRDPGFGTQVDRALATLEEQGYRFDPDAFIRDQDFVRAVIRTPEAALQLDFVNDTAPRFGSLASGDLFPRIDALRNILSNKMTALFRLEAKDFADLRTIANHLAFHWTEVMTEAGEKLLGMDAVNAADLIRCFPPDRFDAINWRKRPDRGRFLADLTQMAEDLIQVGPNSLAPRNPESRAG